MLDGLKTTVRNVKKEIRIYQNVAKDERTPRLGKFFLGLAMGYVLLPFDLIPDFIPIIGYCDDVVIIPLLFWIALKLIPKEIIDDHRKLPW